VTWSVSQNFGGLENLALIPGTVGAAPIQNIGAYGGELTKTFISLNAVRLRDGELQTFSADECEFGYRDSVFKGRLKEQQCIVGVDLRLTKLPHEIDMSYGVINDVIAKKGIEDPGIRDVYDAVIEIRRSKLPDPLEYGNAGSFFKNPTISIAKYEGLLAEYPNMPSFLTEENQYKIPAGWLIEQCGWKGKRIGNVGCFEKQALVIVNYGGASGREVYDLAMRVRDSVLERFDIALNPEVNVIPLRPPKLVGGG
jgi:UDP-N-acetylmuramate dehydrogenase